ncbi:glutathione binding-like protein [Kordiimonas sp. SCSIO 12610]|uniref:glutathione binding-like protein n=1 Tax=Kordiimonas sp. SCSIO 12610 TaxID=2829597 RepID=UPI00210B63B1|nr:glutathione binding-like protein [Kordiimonas sp. SCSIO 12610]UTW55986.1 glutathione S-transferase C-terminal domain-containing protein [Kordiimonas sp. SCSIO 12610]
MPATLFHAPLTCSLAARFAAAEGGVGLDIEYLNLSTKALDKGGSLYDINPLGQVSTLKLENGDLLTETSACITWIQAQSQNDDFRIAPDDPMYFQMLRWLGFCATELHKQIFRVVFYSEATDAVKDRIRALAPERFKFLDTQLKTHEYLLGDRFSAADAYLTWFFVLAGKAQLDFSRYDNLTAYSKRTLNRPMIKTLIESDMKKRVEQG